MHGREPRHWFEPAYSLYRWSRTHDVQNRMIYQDRTMPEEKMTSRVNRSSELFPPEDAGLIRRNWRVGLRIIFGLFWGADAYLKWSLIAQGIDYRDLVSSAAAGQPSIVASWIKFWADNNKFNPRFPLRNSRGRNRHCRVDHHRTLHKTYFNSRNCLQLPHLEYR